MVHDEIMFKQVVLLSKELLPDNIAHLNGSLSVKVKLIIYKKHWNEGHSHRIRHETE